MKFASLLVLAVSLYAQTKTTIQETSILDPAGHKITSGSIKICGPYSFEASTSFVLQNNCTTVNITPTGFTASLIPTDTAQLWYTATWTTPGGVIGPQIWLVPASATTLRLSDIIVGPGSTVAPPWPTGPQGSQGAAATIRIGTTTTLPPGSQAAVRNSGTSGAAILDFDLPSGPTGATGATGAAGATGATGPQGDPGSAATVSVGSTITLPAGSSASVTNGGTSSAAVLNFSIPAGAAGADGATGPAGATGPQGPPGVPDALVNSAIDGTYCLQIVGHSIVALVTCTAGVLPTSWATLDASAWASLTSGVWAAVTI